MALAIHHPLDLRKLILPVGELFGDMRSRLFYLRAPDPTDHISLPAWLAQVYSSGQRAVMPSTVGNVLTPML